MAKVKIYTTSTCQYCDMAKEFFKSKNIEYEEKNVRDDPEAAKEAVELSGQGGVPVIEIGDTVIVGFNKPAIEEALAE